MASFKNVNGIRIPLSPEEEFEFDEREAEWIAGADARAAEEFREERKKLIVASDWTQLADAPVNKSAWATYRQDLRDVPQQAGFPNTITWPNAPEGE